MKGRVLFCGWGESVKDYIVYKSLSEYLNLDWDVKFYDFFI